MGDSKVRPGIEEGYKACLNATDKQVAEGCVGAGTGATVAKILGLDRAVKSGLGTASYDLGGGLVVAALAVVNAIGDVVDFKTGRIVAGPRKQDGKGFLRSTDLLGQRQKKGSTHNALPENTTLGVVATNAGLNKEQVNKLAQMAQDGLARAVNPSHTMSDGDTVFALSIGNKTGDLTALGTIAAEVMAHAIVRAVQQAKTLAGIPAVRDLK
jgi:L-aminopeptidase/D-esterase-like protein